MNAANSLLARGAFAFLVFTLPVHAQEFDITPELAKPLLILKDRCIATDAVWVARMALSTDNGKIVLATGKIFSSIKGDADTWKRVRVWDISEGTKYRALTGHNHPLQSIAFSKDGGKIIGAEILLGREPPETEVMIWDLPSGKLENRFFLEGRAFLAGDRLVTVLPQHGKVPGKIMVFEVGKACKKVFSADVPGIGHAVLSADGSAVACTATIDKIGIDIVDAPRSVQVWEVVSGKEQARFDLPGDAFVLGNLFFSRDGRVLCYGGVARSPTYCWNVPDKKLLKRYLFAGQTLSADGNYLLGNYFPPPLRAKQGIALLSIKTGKIAAELEYDDPEWKAGSYVIAADRSIAVVGGGPDGKIRIWELPKDLPE